MRYMLLIFTNPESWASLSEQEAKEVNEQYFAFTRKITESGEYVDGAPLLGPETATTVKVRAGSRSTTDGPFVETKEHLAGYYTVDCDSLDRALELAAEIPDARFAAVEVRPVMEFAMPPADG
jgi:hypothetical protein